MRIIAPNSQLLSMEASDDPACPCLKRNRGLCACLCYRHHALLPLAIPRRRSHAPSHRAASARDLPVLQVQLHPVSVHHTVHHVLARALRTVRVCPPAYAQDQAHAAFLCRGRIMKQRLRHLLRILVRWAMISDLLSIILFAAAGSTSIISIPHYLAVFSSVLLLTMLAVDPQLARERERPGPDDASQSLRFAAGFLFLLTIVV